MEAFVAQDSITQGGLDDAGDAARWTAVAARDALQDGRFVYAVTTTGIYCRPSCPSRRPRREHARYFVDGAAAAVAGFRACLRCLPDATGGADARAAAARAYLDARPDARVGLVALAAAVGGSPFHLQRTFKAAYGVSPAAYARARRAELLKAGLRAGRTVGRAAADAGYGSGSRVYDGAAGRLAMSPAAYRRGGAGERLRFATAGCALGRVLVASTERGVASVTVGDSDDDLLASLGAEYPRAELVRDDEGLAAWVEAAVRAAASGLDAGAAAAVPLDVEGTEFQWRVWRALQAIPVGETRSYAEVAELVGRGRSAARAVARACASNRVALLIPCHRVVRGTAELGGYRWGVARKAALLAGEQRPAR